MVPQSKGLLCVVLAHISVMSVHCNITQRTIYVQRLQGQRLSAGYQTLQAQSVVRCVGLCNRDSQCAGASYRAIGGECELSSIGHTRSNHVDWEVLQFNAWFVFGDFEYTLVRDKRDWERAQANCASVPSYLTDVTSLEENRFIEPLIKDSQEAWWWMGARDPGHTRDWRWVSGAAVNDSVFTNWNQGEPNGEDLHEYCAFLDKGFGWRDGPCSLELPSVCKRTRIR